MPKEMVAALLAAFGVFAIATGIAWFVIGVVVELIDAFREGLRTPAARSAPRD